MPCAWLVACGSIVLGVRKLAFGSLLRRRRRAPPRSDPRAFSVASSEFTYTARSQAGERGARRRGRRGWDVRLLSTK